MTRAELTSMFGELAQLTKHAAYEALIEHHGEARTLQGWLHAVDTQIDDVVYHVTIAPIVLRYRLLHWEISIKIGANIRLRICKSSNTSPCRSCPW